MANPLVISARQKGVKIMTMTTQRRPRQQSSAPTRRGDPVGEIEQRQDQMGQLIRSFFRDPFAGRAGDQPPIWTPAADIEETDDAYVLELELPGVRREDVNIELRDNEVRVTGEIKQQERKGILRRQTRRIGQFEFVVTLPGDIDPNKVDATLHEGVLTVRLGKEAASQQRRIEIKD
jgi:HSP20 family protein